MPFEDWMVSEKMPDGISFVLEGNDWNKDNIILQEHPELLQIEPGDETIDELVIRDIENENETININNTTTSTCNNNDITVLSFNYN